MPQIYISLPLTLRDGALRRGGCSSTAFAAANYPSSTIYTHRAEERLRPAAGNRQRVELQSFHI